MTVQEQIRTVEVFDPAMCCSTGVCGPSVDPALAQFAGDLEWLGAQDAVSVTRYNLAQQPGAFAERDDVKAALRGEGRGVPAAGLHRRPTRQRRPPTRVAMRWPDGRRAGSRACGVGVDSGGQGAGGDRAAVTSNCEPCLEHHVGVARELGVADEDITRTVRTAKAVKETPARSILDAADRLLGTAARRSSWSSDVWLRRLLLMSTVLTAEFLDAPTRTLFFTGKGGTGKTSIGLRKRGRAGRRRSPRPAGQHRPGVEPQRGAARPRSAVRRPRSTGRPGLDAIDIDPEAAAAAYRERVVGPYRDALPAAAVASIEEQLSGACTVEIAAFDEFARLLGDAGRDRRLRPRDLRHRPDRSHPAAAAPAQRLERVHRHQHDRHLLPGTPRRPGVPALAVRRDVRGAHRPGAHDDRARQPARALGARRGRAQPRGAGASSASQPAPRPQRRLPRQ